MTMRKSVVSAAIAAAVMSWAPARALAQRTAPLRVTLDRTPAAAPAKDTLAHLFTRADRLASAEARRAAQRTSGLRVLVSVGARRLWVVSGRDTLLDAPVAVATRRTLNYAGRQWTFATPLGVRVIRGKRDNPYWRPPEWAYAEIAQQQGLRLATLQHDRPVRLRDGRQLVIRDSLVGIMMPDGFAPLPVDEHIVFDETLFVPPFGTKNRLVEGELGPYQLDLGGRYLLHGAPNDDSIDKATTHGCVRLRGRDLEWMFANVPVGTPVYVY